MMEQERTRESPGPMAVQAEPDKQGDRPPMRRGQRDQEPVIVEIAWLVIEGARLFQRLRRILGRI